MDDLTAELSHTIIRTGDFITDDCYFCCSCGIAPAKLTSGQCQVIKGTNQSFYLTTASVKTTFSGDFVCQYTSYLLAMIAALIAVCFFAAPLAATILVSAIAGGVGIGAGALLCGYFASSHRTWFLDNQTIKHTHNALITSHSFMQCSLFGGQIRPAPNVKNFWDVLALTGTNAIHVLLSSAFIGAGVYTIGYTLKAGMAEFISNFVLNYRASLITAVGLFFRTLFGLDNVVHEYYTSPHYENAGTSFIKGFFVENNIVPMVQSTMEAPKKIAQGHYLQATPGLVNLILFASLGAPALNNGAREGNVETKARSTNQSIDENVINETETDARSTDQSIDENVINELDKLSVTEVQQQLNQVNLKLANPNLSEEAITKLDTELKVLTHEQKSARLYIKNHQKSIKYLEKELQNNTLPPSNPPPQKTIRIEVKQGTETQEMNLNDPETIRADIEEEITFLKRQVDEAGQLLSKKQQEIQAIQSQLYNPHLPSEQMLKLLNDKARLEWALAQKATHHAKTRAHEATMYAGKQLVDILPADVYSKLVILQKECLLNAGKYRRMLFEPSAPGFQNLATYAILKKINSISEALHSDLITSNPAHAEIIRQAIETIVNNAKMKMLDYLQRHRAGTLKPLEPDPQLGE